MSEKRLMMTEEEVRKRKKELLQKTPDDLITSYMFQEQENERLNNIIDELEKYLDEALGQDMYRYDFKIILDKLQELKGSDKE